MVTYTCPFSKQTNQGAKGQLSLNQFGEAEVVGEIRRLSAQEYSPGFLEAGSLASEP